MGKVKKTKTKSKASNETTTHEEPVLVHPEENAIHTILDQLQSTSVEEKYCGLQTLAMLIENPENMEQIISTGLIKVAGPLLLDSAGSVRNAAAGVLRNLSATGHHTCEILMEQDIMTPLTCYFHQHAENLTPDPSSKTKNEDIDTFVQNINLLWNLCESSDLAVKYLEQSRILDILPGYLDQITFGEDVVTSVLQCLFVVAEDNPAVSEKIKTNCERQLQQLLALEGSNPSTLLIKTLSAGVVINISGGSIGRLPVGVVNQIISILAEVLSVDHRLSCSQLSSNVPLKTASGKIDPLDDKAATVVESQIKAVSQVIEAQQSSIEIVANICSCQDADDGNAEDSLDSDEIDEEELCEDDGEIILSEDKLPPEVMEALTSQELFHKVWARAQLPAENVMLILMEYGGSQLLCKKLHSLQTQALLCVNNMLSSLPIDNFGGVNGVYKIWVDAGKLVFKQKSNNVSLLESATAVMRAALDKIKFRENGNTSETELFNDLALSDIEMMLNGIKECDVPEIKSNLIRMIGILALLLVSKLNDTTCVVIVTITDFILDQAHKENVVWVLAEAVDTLVDLYSEDETDILAAKVKLVEKLAVLAPILKNKARQQKKLPKEYKVLVSTAINNLPRFIKYKRERVALLQV